MTPEEQRHFAFLGDSLSWMFTDIVRIQPEGGWTGHVPFAHWLIGAMRPKVLVELGTHGGTSYSAFCESVKHNRLPTKCFAVDTWQGDAHAGGYDDAVFRDLTAFHDARYRSFSNMLRKTFDAALSDFPDDSVDLLHIDGFHTYEAVRHDFETWYPKLSANSVVLFHDTCERSRGFGVWQFWAELREQFPGFEFTHSHGLGVLRVGNGAAPPLAALCAITDQQVISRIRSRFEYLGRRAQLESELLRYQIGLGAAQAELERLRAAAMVTSPP